MGTLRVLLVEDSENDAILLLRELRRGGYQPIAQMVYTAEGMEVAIRAAEERNEPFQVVISDYYMPRFRAPDALGLLRELGYDVPFIVVSGKIGEDAAVEIMKAGANDYLTKENMSRLCPAIEREVREAEVRGERERAEKALGLSEDRFRRLVEQIPAVTYVQEPIDSDTPKAITYMSPQYEDMLGYPAETEILDEEHWLRMLHPDDRERVLAEELRTDETGEPYRIEYRLIARDGRVVWVHDEATLVRDEEGNALYWLGVQYDITEQKRIEEELRQSEERFKVLSQEVVEGIILSENGRIIDANRSVTEMFGYRLEELIGKDAIELTPSEYREMVRQRISDEDTRHYESRGLKKDGTIFSYRDKAQAPALFWASDPGDLHYRPDGAQASRRGPDHERGTLPDAGRAASRCNVYAGDRERHPRLRQPADRERARLLARRIPRKPGPPLADHPSRRPRVGAPGGHPH